MTLRNKRFIGVLAAAVAILAMVVGLVMVAASLHMGPWQVQAVTPQRTSQPPSSTAVTQPVVPSSASSDPVTSPAKQTPTQAPIAPSPPTEVSIKGVLNVRVGGSIALKHSPDCRGGVQGDPCLFPPEDNGAYKLAYYRCCDTALPSVPSSNTTYIVGHSYRFEPDAAFNNLPTTRKGDVVVVKTKDAVFRYLVTKTANIPFAEVPHRADIWAKVPNQLVLMTCALREDKSPSIKNFVVWATMISATPAGH